MIFVKVANQNLRFKNNKLNLSPLNHDIILN